MPQESDDRGKRSALTITPAKAEIFIRGIRSGNTTKAALSIAGISERSFYNYRDYAQLEGCRSEYERERKRYAEALMDSFENARQLAVPDLQQVLFKAATTAQWIERTKTVHAHCPCCGGEYTTLMEEHVEILPDAKTATWLLEGIAPRGCLALPGAERSEEDRTLEKLFAKIDEVGPLMIAPPPSTLVSA